MLLILVEIKDSLLLYQEMNDYLWKVGFWGPWFLFLKKLKNDFSIFYDKCVILCEEKVNSSNNFKIINLVIKKIR